MTPPLRPQAERCPEPECSDKQQCWRCDYEESPHIGQYTAATITQEDLDGLRAELEQAKLKAAAMTAAMKSTAADALAHGLCHMKLMAQCTRAEKTEATARRLNRRAQAAESENARYRRAVAQWDISDKGTYIPYDSLALIGRTAGANLLGSVRHLRHFERVEQAESALAALKKAHVALAEQAGRDQAVLRTFTDILEGFGRLLATSSRDWSEYRVDAWIWAVVLGWGCEQPECNDTCLHGVLEKVATDHGWNAETLAKVRRYRATVRAALDHPRTKET